MVEPEGWLRLVSVYLCIFSSISNKETKIERICSSVKYISQPRIQVYMT